MYLDLHSPQVAKFFVVTDLNCNMSDRDFLYKCTIIVVEMFFHLGIMGIKLYIFFCYLNVLICGMLLLILDVRGRTSALSLGPSYSLRYQALARVDVGYVRAHLIYIIWQCVTNKKTRNSS